MDYSNHQNYCKFLGIDLSSQTNATIPQQINFKGKLEAPFIKCITKTDGTTTDDAEDLDLVMTMYNLLE